jgi:hypothetical protein
MDGLQDYIHNKLCSNVLKLLDVNPPQFKGIVTVGWYRYRGKPGQVAIDFEGADCKRWVLPVDFAVSLLVTRPDQLRTISDVRSPYAEYVRAAYSRFFDDQVIRAGIGPAKAGAYESMSDISLPDCQKIPTNASGLTMAKLLIAKEILDAEEIDPNEERFMAATSKQVSELLNSTEVKSADYNTVSALAQGQIDTFMGFKFVRSERLTKVSTTRSCLAWVKSGLHVGHWEGLTVERAEPPDSNYVCQICVRTTLGTTRTQEKKVVQIDCLE